jgi:hypothetical protein
VLGVFSLLASRWDDKNRPAAVPVARFATSAKLLVHAWMNCRTRSSR